jgi:hypothetical protein
MARHLAGIVHIRGTDDENWPWSDEHVERSHSVSTVLDFNQPEVSLDIPDVRWGGECRVEMRLKARVVDDGRIQIESNCKLFEGDSEDTQDLEHEKGDSFLVGRNTRTNPGATKFDVQLSNRGLGGGDHAEIGMSFTNTLLEED